MADVIMIHETNNYIINITTTEHTYVYFKKEKLYFTHHYIFGRSLPEICGTYGDIQLLNILINIREKQPEYIIALSTKEWYMSALYGAVKNNNTLFAEHIIKNHNIRPSGDDLRFIFNTNTYNNGGIINNDIIELLMKNSDFHDLSFVGMNRYNKYRILLYLTEQQAERVGWHREWLALHVGVRYALKKFYWDRVVPRMNRHPKETVPEVVNRDDMIVWLRGGGRKFAVDWWAFLLSIGHDIGPLPDEFVYKK